SIENGKFKVRVRYGTSSTWGNFGGESFVVDCPARMPNLATYSPTVSTTKSRVAFAAHRVEHFVMKRIRYYQNGDLVQFDPTDRQVYPPQE
ncbi:MAG: hypothetical protein B7Z55_13950, partial [Planctomycetales bacterium 12-60-4]